MNYSEALTYIHSSLRLGSRPGLERITDLLHRLGDPQKELRCLHVAGTNGKGSTCRMMQTALTAAGYRCGLYTSPYVIDFCERIQIDGVMISHEDLAAVMTRVKAVIDTMPEEDVPTEFERITAAAFLYYAEQKVDVVVLEVGLGGRLDATNVIEKPLVSVITHIDLDHTELLGNTLAAIAAEKAGILKPNCPAVIGSQVPEVVKTVQAIAAERNCALAIAGDPAAVKVTAEGTEFSYSGREYRMKLLGEHQAENAALAIEALAASGLCVPDEAVGIGIETALMPARTERISTDPFVLLDGSHNPNGLHALAALLDRLDIHHAVGIVGMMADKDIDTALGNIYPYFDTLITLTVTGNPRSISAEALLGKVAGKVKNTFAAPDIPSALAMASAVSDQDPVIVFGSLYLAGEIREPLKSFFN